MAAVAFDLSRWPVVIATASSELTDAKLAGYLAGLDALLNHGARFALILDTRGLRRVPTAGQILEFRHWVVSRRPRWEELCAAYVVVEDSLLARGLAAATGHLVRLPPIYHATRTVEQAVAWALPRLGGVAPSEPPTSLDGIYEALPSLPALAPLLDLFDEAAYLMRGTGEVVFANTAARSEHGPNPAWLAKVLSPENCEEITPCRTARVSWERDLYVVIPVPATLADLPPSLRQVAERLLEGLSDKEIASALDIPLATVRTYVARIFRRLDVHSRSELVRRLGPPVVL